jgi:hypothetical protein
MTLAWQGGAALLAGREPGLEGAPAPGLTVAYPRLKGWT